MKIETITKQKMENYRITKENTIKKKTKTIYITSYISNKEQQITNSNCNSSFSMYLNFKHIIV